MSTRKRFTYQAMQARDLFYEAMDLHDNQWVKCMNPDCNRSQLTDKMHLHHLLPRHIAPSWTYEPKNMILLCAVCHHKIHYCEALIFSKKKKK